MDGVGCLAITIVAVGLIVYIMLQGYIISSPSHTPVGVVVFYGPLVIAGIIVLARIVKKERALSRAITVHLY